MKPSAERALTCVRAFWWAWKRAMSEPCGSISGWPSVIHSATIRAIPGASLIQTAAAAQRPLTSGVSPRIGIPSGVSDSRPLI